MLEICLNLPYSPNESKYTSGVTMFGIRATVSCNKPLLKGLKG